MPRPVPASARRLAAAALLVAMLAPSTSASAQRRRDAMRAVTGVAREFAADERAPVGWRQPARERSRTGRTALQFVAASLGAAGGGVGTFLILRDVGTRRVEGDAGYTRAGNVGYLAGSVAGATVGAHLVGTSMGGRSPLWATALGALVGTAPLIALGVDEPYMPLFGLALGWIPQAALATGGFNMGESRE